jgi:hypothetical protein
MRFKYLLITGLLFSLSTTYVHAGPYGDDLAKCLVASTTKEDRASLVRWMFAAAAANPAVASIANVSPKVLAETNASTGALFMRLLTDTCKDKAKTALTYEGPATIQLSFTVLGQVAAGELFSSPEVRKAMSGLETSIDKKKLEELTNIK